MASVMAEIFKNFTWYFADSLYPLLFLLSLLLICLYPGAKKERLSLVWPNLLFAALIFCPVSAYLIMKMIGSLVYWRMFWMLTIPIVIAYAGVRLITTPSGKPVRLLTALLAAVAIVFSGHFVFTGEYFSERTNFFKIPTEAIYVSEAISAHAAEQNIESPKAAVTGYLSVYIRQYDAGIRLAYGRNMVKGDVAPSKLYTELNSESPNPKRLARLARKAECDYLVLPTSLDLDDALSEYSFVKTEEAGGYTIYYNEENDYG
ncbi:MAG: hypothetical protein LIO94_02970 [Clostridiales bacterium]|nr:hypothetical protein [Clostridiales bacterium]